MKKVFCVLGPTASGKTAYTLALAREFPIEIISVDSAAIYKGMDIGTAKPSTDEKKICPFHLIDIVQPDEVYSAASFVQDATRLIDEIYLRGRLPVLVGGTMLYFHAFQHGLSQLPEANPTLRSDIQRQAEEKGWTELHQQLKKIDPDAAEKIRPQDSQRISRALEVYHLTGKPLSELHKEKNSPPYDCYNLIFMPEDRSWLHERIAVRFQRMIEQGLIKEVERIRRDFPNSKEMPSLRSVGYKQVLQYLEHAYSYGEMIEKGIIATRQLAKRQYTWLRSWKHANYLDSQKEIEREVKQTFAQFFIK